VKHRKSRMAQNPKTLEPVPVPAKRTVKFKVGRLMKQTLSEDGAVLTLASMARHDDDEDAPAPAKSKPTHPAAR